MHGMIFLLHFLILYATENETLAGLILYATENETLAGLIPSAR